MVQVLSGLVSKVASLKVQYLIGPLLFLLYVNDILDIISCGLKLFADDAKIYSPIKYPSDVAYLQYNLDLMNNWSLKWQLYLNISKCKFISLSNSMAYTYYY